MFENQAVPSGVFKKKPDDISTFGSSLDSLKV
jgi:hypothetical protein